MNIIIVGELGQLNCSLVPLSGSFGMKFSILLKRPGVAIFDFQFISFDLSLCCFYILF